MSDYLPQEVWIDILTRLPIKTLLQFRSVCKVWYSLISTSLFISTHINRTQKISNSYDSHTLLLRHFNDSAKHHNNKEHYLLLNDNQTLGGHIEELKFHIKSKSNYQFRIVGSCNGLLCLSDDYSNNGGDVIICNPSIRKCLTLPRPRVTELTHGSHIFVLGFGFDCNNDDYKVVRVAYIKGRNERDLIPPEVEVYSLSSGIWRSFSTGAPPYGMFGYSWSQAFLNGVVHWIGYDPCVRDGNNCLIVSIDMGDEVFRELMLPGDLAAQCGQNLTVSVYGEALSVFNYYYRGKRQCCSIWVLKEYGVVDSWTKLYGIDLEGGLQKIVGFRMNGEVLLVTARGKLISYDPNNQRMTTLGIRGTADSFFVGTYTESLVLMGAESVDVPGSSCDDITYKGGELECGGFEDQGWPGVLEEERKNRMSSSSTDYNNPTEFREIRYQNKSCKCGHRCAVKITKSNKKNNKGRLYYVCPDGGCKFWSWCNPLSLTQLSTSATSHRNIERPDQGTEGGRRHDPRLELRSQCGAISAQLQVVSSRQNNMHMLIHGCLVISLLSIAISIAALLFK